MILRQPLQSRHIAAHERKGSVVHRRPGIADVYVHVGLRAVPEEGGDIRLPDAQRQTMVQYDEIRRVPTAFLHGLHEFLLLLLPQTTAHAIQLE